MNYFFIDFENVHSSGLDGIENFGKDDVIYLMYTNTCKTIQLTVMDKLLHCGRDIKLNLVKVSVGTKNALDFQLSSYLGYLIAKTEKQKCSYYIVSNDTGYDFIVSFWNEQGVDVSRIPNFLSLNKQENKLLKTISIQLAEEETENIAPVAVKPRSEAASKKPSNPKEKTAPAAAKPNSKSKSLGTANKKELLQYISDEEYSDNILAIINKYKTIVSIKNGFDKEYRDAKKSSALYKKVKPYLKTIGKT